MHSSVEYNIDTNLSEVRKQWPAVFYGIQLHIFQANIARWIIVSAIAEHSFCCRRDESQYISNWWSQPLYKFCTVWFLYIKAWFKWYNLFYILIPMKCYSITSSDECNTYVSIPMLFINQIFSETDYIVSVTTEALICLTVMWNVNF